MLLHQAVKKESFRLYPLSLWSYVYLDRGIPGWGSLDRSCEVIVRECRRHIDMCPGGRGTYQAVFKPERPATTPRKENRKREQGEREEKKEGKKKGHKEEDKKGDIEKERKKEMKKRERKKEKEKEKERRKRRKRGERKTA